MKILTQNHKRFIKFFILTVCNFILITGCGGQFGTGVTEAVLEKELPKSHLWEYLSTIGDEPKDYALYTYVLYGRKDNNSDHYRKSSQLINIIQWSTQSTENYSEHGDFDKTAFNLFLIPDWELDIQLSKSILTHLSIISQDAGFQKSLLNPGPFLISVKTPISLTNRSKKSDLLYVDLSTSNGAAMEEIVLSYKTRLTEVTIQGTDRFKSIKLALLDIILDADDYIQIVKTAYADLLPKK